jgi:hypothetical protein
VQVDDPTILFRFVGSLSATDRGLDAGTNQPLAHTLVKHARLYFLQRAAFNGFQENGRDEGGRTLGREIEKHGREPKPISTSAWRTQDLGARVHGGTSKDRFGEEIVATSQRPEVQFPILESLGLRLDLAPNLFDCR